MSRGDLVPDELGVEVLKRRLAQEDVATKGWIGDAWTRERINSESLIAHGILPDLIFVIDVPRDVLLHRLSGRRQDPVTKQMYHLDNLPDDVEVCSRLVQRKDDTDRESIFRRLDLHEQLREETLQPWRNAGVPVAVVNGALGQDEVFESLDSAVTLARAKACEGLQTPTNTSHV
eukprot:TRINITY_DN28388_c0_g1_i1.p1 TRINITY_DN28388_c0_g1~~TRINITY_DN28388_c0_g1_i1.p1  ORF type:complete len:175 (+),score=21.63 TRINITY_DN28388_c0_g1_i1:267-791(+)